MRSFVIAAALVLAGLGALAVRVVVEGRAALAAGDDWVARGKPGEAIRAFEASARWYVPLAPHVNDAYARLRGLAASEDPAVAVAAWRAIRSAARATRTLWTPHADDLAAADAAIARLAAKDPQGAPVDAVAGDSPASRLAWQEARLAREVRPGHGAALLAVFGIALWIGGAVVLVRRGLDAGGAVVRRPALVSCLMVVVGLVCWAAGLYNA